MKSPAREKRTGILACYTGTGKGKTTAALGTLVRAVGYGWKACIIQFMKGSWDYGEMEGLDRLKPNVELYRMGKGFYKIIDDDLPEEEHRKAAVEALAFSRKKLVSGKYDLVVLDELNVALSTGLLKVGDVLSALSVKPKWLHVIVTGRGAPEELISAADLVTDMNEVKHPFNKGLKAQKGFDF